MGFTSLKNKSKLLTQLSNGDKFNSNDNTNVNNKNVLTNRLVHAIILS